MITCLNPQIVYNKYLGKHIAVPCGKCDACKCLRANEWASRCELEQNGHRFVYFGTLTYDNEHYPRFDVRQLYNLGDDEFDLLFDESIDFLQIYDYNIRIIDYRDIQLFFKHLRNEIYKTFRERIPFTYFVACEYGSTTFHPHYHLLLFFDDERLSLHLKEFVYKAWFFKNPHPTFSRFFKFNRWERVRSSASQYVAGYLNTTSNIPPILRYSLFRAKHQCSKSSPFGIAGVHVTSLQTFQSGNPCKFSYQRPTSARIVDVSLWRGIEMRFFPRCLGFSILSDFERMSMYELSRRYSQGDTFISFAERFLCEWIFISPTSDDWRILFAVTCETKEKNKYLQDKICPFDVEKLRKAYYLSKRFLSLCGKLPSYLYYGRIKDYYERKEYNSLCNQLQQQVDLVSQLNGHKYLPFIPFIIDSLFYENKRHLPLSTRAYYVEQFHLVDDWSNYSFQKSYLYRDKKYLYNKIALDNTKVKIKKDYLALHPEFMNVYKSIFTKPILT